MVFEIHTYGNAEFIRLVFNYVAMIFNDGDFAVLANAVALLGFIAVMGKAAFNKEGLNVFRTHFILVFLILVAYVPKTTVAIIDDVVPANNSIVGNVPLGLAATAGFFSTVGYWLTDTYETVTAVPTFAQTTSSGFLFHQEVFKRADQAKLLDDRNKYNFDQFVASCIVVDGIGHERFTYEELKSSANPLSFLSARLSDADVSQFYYVPSSGAMNDKQIATCKTGFDNIIKPSIEDGKTKAYGGISLGFMENYNGTQEATNTLLPKIFAVGTAMLRGDSGSTAITFPEYIERKILFNELDKSVAMFASGVGATEASDYIMEKANTNRQLTYSMTHELATQKLPKLKMIIEGILYGIFPIIALLAILSPVKVLLNYAKALVWISLWPVMFALLNSIIVHYDQKNLNAIVQYYGGFSSSSMIEINKYLAENGNITAGLMISLPMITWLLLSAGGTMLSSLSGKVLGGMEKDVEGATKEIVEGQGRYAGQSWQTVAHQNEAIANNTNNGISVSSVMERGGIANTTTSAMGDATHSMQANSSSAMLSYTQSSEFTDRASSQYQNAVSSASQKQQAFSDQLDASYGIVQSRNQQWSDSENRQVQKSYTESDAATEQRTAITESVTQYAHQNNFSTQETATLLASVGGSLGIRAMGMGGSLGGQGSASEVSQTQESRAKLEQFKQSEAGQSMLQKVVQSMQSDAYTEKFGYDKSFQDQLKATSSMTRNAAMSYNDALNQVESAALTQEQLVSFSNKESSDMASYIANETGISVQEYEKLDWKAYNGDEAAKQELMSLISSSFIPGKEDVQAHYNWQGGEVYNRGSDKIDSNHAESMQKVADDRADFFGKIDDRAREIGVSPNKVSSQIEKPMSEIGISPGLVGSDNAGVGNRNVMRGDEEYSPSVIKEVKEQLAENVSQIATQAEETVIDKGSDVVVAAREKIEDIKENPGQVAKETVQDVTIGTGMKVLVPLAIAGNQVADLSQKIFTRADEKSSENNGSAAPTQDKDENNSWSLNPFSW